MKPSALRGTPRHLSALALSACVLALSGCAITMPATKVDAAVAPQWQAPLPHQGTVGALSQWWQQQGDPLLVELIEAAQAVSPSVAQAVARVESARAQRTTANAALLPKVDASVAASRGVSQPNVPVATTQTIGLQATWELDLVGANRAVSNAADAQFQGTQAQWHDARVSVAAEVASTYYSLSTCYQLLDVARKDAASRQETARLADISAKAGFTAPSVAALARASAADGSSRVTQQSAACDIDTKALVALTGLAEADLRQKLAAALAKPAQAAPVSIASVPAQTLTQRPDVFAAEREVVVASAQVGSAKAQRYPRLTLSGNVGAMRYSSMGTETNLDTWSFGPLALTLPIFDGGQRKANVVAAEANYTQAVAVYRAKVRQAVREVEEALVNLQSTDARRQDAEVSTQGYAESLAATQSRYGQGLANLVELEDARRSALASQSAELSLALERNRAWVALYRALGGGFEPSN
ncbi:efflux transporter outer membrane subunit [Rhodoferax saidenbachensis]|uniref:NodT family efflux transporter outer membrane factor (OMF) lipoprotein n=1 Tax=Rhodoferax saidenbachensis TaxID=1484693 RepID=A0ABU1ZM00_9BURK|nr:efflux transporter outer membrane subunit [Rhodoferax saidenbachensis]MDR7306503.1 NodT family efflux transporter outer membrane factor (OMF) lipoprotein [Rhodoferax saidenbachensis]